MRRLGTTVAGDQVITDCRLEPGRDECGDRRRESVEHDRAARLRRTEQRAHEPGELEPTDEPHAAERVVR